MLDFRMITFLEVCRTLNYTRAADQLAITQPAVSQHISYLERYYGAKLFSYQGKRLSLTPAGQVLQSVAMHMEHDEKLLADSIASLTSQHCSLSLGVTLTVGEYLVADPLARYVATHQNMDISIEQNDTEALLSRLRSGQIDCALIEGYFDKHDLAWRVFARQELVAVCAATGPETSAPARFEDLLSEHVLVREAGSGTRAVLEHALAENNLTVKSFARVTEVSSINIIKAFVAKGVGISFLYDAAVRTDLDQGILRRLPLAAGPIEHDITFVYLKGSAFSQRMEDFFADLAACVEG